MAVTPAGAGAVSQDAADPVLRVNPIACHAHGLCAELLPELVDLDEWGYPMLAGGARGTVPASLVAQAKAAVAACPTLALRLSYPPRVS